MNSPPASLSHAELTNTAQVRVFAEPLGSQWGDVALKSGIAFFSSMVIAMAIGRGYRPFAIVAALGARNSALAVLWWVFGVVSVGYFAATFWHAFRYRPVATLRDEELPTCTVIVPAYNEGPMVRIALSSILQSWYPADRLQIIAVDDGSTDDTWGHIEALAATVPGRVTTIRQPRNRGKREALRAGFLRATGDVIVTVDSDSKIERGALRSLATPFVTDPEVGAVSGKVMVLNRYANLLTRLLAARFFVTFDLARAAQSRFGAVLCTPGALSAYRRSAVLSVLAEWSSQTFLGQPCTIAEDRALTTWLLRRGHRAVYQSSAVVHTLVPTDLAGVARTFVRWERGNIREDLVMIPTLFSSWRTRDRWWPTFEIVFELIQYPIGYVVLALSIRVFLVHPAAIVQVAAMVAITSLLQSLYSLRSERKTDFIYGIAYAFVALIGLQWVFPYSLLTVRNGKWLTR